MSLMRRSTFKPRREPRPVKTIDYTPRPRSPAVSIADGKARIVVPIPKQEYVRSEAYRRWVATLPCAHCGIVGFSQCAHSDDNGSGGKGMGIKASDDTCYPACGPRGDEPGCHWRIGSSGAWSKQERRQMEAEYAARTRALWVRMK